jgi:putative selenate reductase
VSDRFQPISTEQLSSWIFTELESEGSIFGTPRELFYTPQPDDRFATRLYGFPLETPIGVAAGPHSQMAQNIVSAWLCGARMIELKTVQTLDAIEVAKPCIDIQDEGYNVEWSQELAIQQSISEYVRAWVLVHVLHYRLGFPGERPGIIFNLSVGYDLDGIRQANVQEFLRAMRDAGELVEQTRQIVATYLPEAEKVPIPHQISDNVTLSTMHGCPPEEIGRIASYLMSEHGLHTSVKLNPTLLGPQRLRRILNHDLGFSEVVIPDSAFAHDLKLSDALDLIRGLAATATAAGVRFGLKLSNTLEVENHRQVFDESQRTMYLSGRPLFGVTVNLAHLLREELHNLDLIYSYAGGADAFSVARLLAAGMRTVTACSDILRTGSYLRLIQYLEEIDRALDEAGADDLTGLIRRTAEGRGENEQVRVGRDTEQELKTMARLNLTDLAETVLKEPAAHKQSFDRSATKSARRLGLFDCIQAPCTDLCQVDQDVPGYIRAVKHDQLAQAAEIVRRDNPLPATLGRACDHLCEQICLRSHYDEPVAIRELKRFIIDQQPQVEISPPLPLVVKAKVAIIGAGPCGIAAATRLRRSGFAVTIFEQRQRPGGMVTGTIPGYRADQAAVDTDLAQLEVSGIEVCCEQRVTDIEQIRRLGYTYVVIGTGAQKGRQLGIEGEQCNGVLDGLDFLRAAKSGMGPQLSGRVGVIGGGDVAADCARTAKRLGASEVHIVYRRTQAEMPARKEELQGLLEEGIGIVELMSPLKVISQSNWLTGISCAQMRLGEPDSSGRRRPVAVPGVATEIELEHLIVAIGQRAELDWLSTAGVELNQSGYIRVNPMTMETSVANLFAGGDVVGDGPATIVKACGDGKRIAGEILARETRTSQPSQPPVEKPEPDRTRLLRLRGRRLRRVPIAEAPAAARSSFTEVVQPLAATAAMEEATRCLECDLMCSTCVTVCPNRALFTYTVQPFDQQLTGLAPDAHSSRFCVSQSLQVAVFTPFCNQCGNCVTFCPTSGRPFADKPRFFLSEEDLAAESDNAFLLLGNGRDSTLRSMLGGNLHKLVLRADELDFTAPGIRVTLDRASFEIRDLELTGGLASGQNVSLKECATMYILLSGLRSSTPWLVQLAGKNRSD